MKYGERVYLKDLPDMTWFYVDDDCGYELKLNENQNRHGAPSAGYTRTWRFYSEGFVDRRDIRVNRVELADVLDWCAENNRSMPDCFSTAGDVYVCPKCVGKKFSSEAKIGKRDPITGERSVFTDSTDCELCSGSGRVNKEKRDEFTNAGKELVNAVGDDS